jgi:hypothetical protein
MTRSSCAARLVSFVPVRSLMGPAKASVAQATRGSNPFSSASVSNESHVACAAERKEAQREVWRMRALGFGMMASISWFYYYAHEYVVFRVVPATLFAATGFTVALAFVLIPTSAYMRKVALRVMPP